MATVTPKVPQEIRYILDVSKEEAEMLVALLGRTNSVYERLSDDVYDALREAGVEEEKYNVNATQGHGDAVITLRPAHV